MDEDLTDPLAGAVARIKARRNLRAQAGMFGVLSLVLVVVWAVSDGGFFWPVFPMLGFALALFGQWRAIDANRPITEAEIARELGDQ